MKKRQLIFDEKTEEFTYKTEIEEQEQQSRENRIIQREYWYRIMGLAYGERIERIPRFGPRQIEIRGMYD